MAFESTMNKIKRRFEELNKFIFVLSIVFGISSWVVFSGVMVEAPLLIKTLPESWALPSIIGMVAQFGQIGPILLYIMKCQMFSCCPGRFMTIRHKKVPDRLIIYTLFAIGLAAMATIALFWDRTFFITGKNRSIVFLAGVFFLAILDCTCTIVFLTYIGKFKKNYVTALYIGEGISSLLPGLFALAQGIGDDESCDAVNLNGTFTNMTNTTSIKQMASALQPNFSVSVYFWILFVILVISMAAFVALDKLPMFKTHKISRHRNKENADEKEKGPQMDPLNEITEEKFEVEPGEVELPPTKKGKYYLYAAITIVAFLLYGFIPGLSSYSALPYGAQTMHLCVSLALIVQPLSSIIATFIQVKSIRNIFILLLAAILVCSYIIIMSALSPCPVLKSHLIGDILMISAWVVSGALLMYLRCVITTLLKKKYGEKSLVSCGLLTQIGQFFGSILIYILIDVAEVFKESKPCISYTC